MKPVWNESYILECYNMVRAGFKINQVAKSLKLPTKVLKKWYANKPAFKQAIDQGVKEAKKVTHESNDVLTIQEFIYKRMPDELKEMYSDLINYSKDNNLSLEARIDALGRDKGEKYKKMLLANLIPMLNFNVSEACRRVGINKKKYQEWLYEDEDFSLIIEEILSIQKDYCEGKLMELVKEKNPFVVVHVNKTLNREKYGDKKSLEITHSGTVGHAVLDINKLSETTKETILNELRESKGEKRLPPRIVEAIPVETFSNYDDLIKQTSEEEEQ